MHTCDFPLVFMEKAMWAGLNEYAPPVAQLMQRFFLEEKVTLEIQRMMETEKLSVVSAVCKWLKGKENRPVWEAWLPPARYRVECELGEKILGGSRTCAKCAAGTYSNERYATDCVACKAGRSAPCLPAIPISSSVRKPLVERPQSPRGVR